MLDNYQRDPQGLIHQVNFDTFPYTPDYVKQNYLHDLVQSMSYLRLGYLLGTLGHIRSLLDVGYGSGAFLKVANQVIPHTCGNDINGYPIPPECQFVQDIHSEFYEVITFFDSLEHFTDVYFLNRLKCKYVTVSLPWCHYFSDKWFESWKHRKPNEHLWHFDQNSLIKFMDHQGFDVINTCNYEDTIRKSTEPYENILSGVFVNRRFLT